MKKAKIALTAVAIVTLISGVFAFKVNRQSRHFYSLGTALFDGVALQGCVVDNIAFLIPVTGSSGTLNTIYSSAVSIGAVTCTVRVTASI